MATQQQQPKHICFYSNKCNWSKAFLEELSKTAWKREFRFVCVDPSPQRPPLPGWLKKVPTLVISGEPEPRTDGEVMNWLSEMRLKNGGSGSGSGGGGGGVQPANGGEPEAWNGAEHQSFAKGFGYSFQTADTSTGGDGGTTIPGAFSFLNGNASPGDRVSQQMSGNMMDTQRRSKKEQLFDSAMEEYKRKRDFGMPTGPGRL
jgi:hypothetical protein